MKTIFAFFAGITLTVGALVVIGAEETSQNGQPEADEAQSSDRYSELVKIDGEFSETFVLPGVDFSQFNKVYLWGAEFEYRDVGPARRTRSTMLSTHKREFGISEADRTDFEEIVGAAFDKEISKGKQFTLIQNPDEIDSATLILRGALIDIISRVPPETVGRTDVYLASVGAATFALECIDARTGYVVALVAERRSIETMNARAGMMVPANSASVMGDIRRWSGDLARRLRARLDKAIKEGATA